MRGARSLWCQPRAGVRIIPADAGSTSTHWPSPTGCWDHPRGCGEHYGILIAGPADPGSSPRMRGARIVSRGENFWRRIIPADAGSTYSRLFISFTITDHPRGCGEHRLQSLTETVTAGSSPRMRGAQWAER